MPTPVRQCAGKDVERAQEVVADGHRPDRLAGRLGDEDLDVGIGERLLPRRADQVVREGIALGRKDVRERGDARAALDREQRVGLVARAPRESRGRRDELAPDQGDAFEVVVAQVLEHDAVHA